MRVSIGRFQHVFWAAGCPESWGMGLARPMKNHQQTPEEAFFGCLGFFSLLEVRYRMAGKPLTLAGFGKESMDVVPPCGGQLVLDAPDLLEH